MPIQMDPYIIQTLNQLAKIDETDFTQSIESIRNSPPKLSPEELAASIEGTNLDRQYRFSLALATCNIFSSFSESGLTKSEFIDDLLESIEKQAQLFNQELEPNYKERNREFFENILNLDSPLAITSKALYLLLEQANIFSDARIITDLRPIFQPRSEIPSKNFIIFHNLRLTYQSRRSRKEILLSLDLSDLQVLKKMISRAIKKEENLRQLLGKNFDILGEMRDEE